MDKSLYAFCACFAVLAAGTFVYGVFNMFAKVANLWMKTAFVIANKSGTVSVNFVQDILLMSISTSILMAFFLFCR